MIKHVPNMLTILRILLVPIIIYLVFQNKYLEAAAMLFVSGMTDMLDGMIARNFDAITNFGKLIDPLADKLTLLSMLVVLVAKGIIPNFVIVIVFIKEFIMVAGASFLFGKKVVVSSKWYGKVTTTILYLAVGMSFLLKILVIPAPWNGYVLEFNNWLYYIGVALTVYSVIMYFIEFYQKGYFKETIKYGKKKPKQIPEHIEKTDT